MFQFETRAGIKNARVFLDNFYLTENNSILNHFFPCFLPEIIKDILAILSLKPMSNLRAIYALKPKRFMRAIYALKPTKYIRFNLARVKESFIRSIN